jgi:hypothetical protein
MVVHGKQPLPLGVALRTLVLYFKPPPMTGRPRLRLYTLVVDPAELLAHATADIDGRAAIT